MALSRDASAACRVEVARKEVARKQQVAALIENVKQLDGLCLTEVELSIALGITTPQLGKRGGTALVSRWRRGSHRPGDEYVAALELLAAGKLRLIEIGREKQRRLFKIVTPEEASCS